MHSISLAVIQIGLKTNRTEAEQSLCWMILNYSWREKKKLLPTVSHSASTRRQVNETALALDDGKEILLT